MPYHARIEGTTAIVDADTGQMWVSEHSDPEAALAAAQQQATEFNQRDLNIIMGLLGLTTYTVPEPVVPLRGPFGDTDTAAE